MGSCVSRPEGCIGQRSRSSKKKSRKRRKTFKKRAPSRLSEGSSDNVDRRSSFTNPTFQGFSSLSLSLLSKLGLFFFMGFGVTLYQEMHVCIIWVERLCDNCYFFFEKVKFLL